MRYGQQPLDEPQPAAEGRVELPLEPQAGGLFADAAPAALAELSPVPSGAAEPTVERALPALGLLILYTGAFITAAFIAFARYDVR